MSKPAYKKLSVDFPANEYKYLRLACDLQEISIKDFVTKAVIQSLEAYEDELDTLDLGGARSEVAQSGTMTWEELEKKLGWDELRQTSKANFINRASFELI